MLATSNKDDEANNKKKTKTIDKLLGTGIANNRVRYLFVSKV